MEQAQENSRAIFIMNSIKPLLLLLVCGVALASAADLNAVHNVYVLPMGNGLEQHLANALTREHVFTIVSDPLKADAVLTSQVSAALQDKLDTLLTPPAKVEGKDDTSAVADAMAKSQSPASNASLGRSKGTVFLLGTKSREVVWSTYELPKNATAKELDRIASVIVSRLKKDMGLKK